MGSGGVGSGVGVACPAVASSPLCGGSSIIVGVGEGSGAGDSDGGAETHVPTDVTIAPLDILIQYGEPVTSSYIVMPVGLSAVPTLSSFVTVAFSTSISLAVSFPFSSILHLPDIPEIAPTS